MLWAQKKSKQVIHKDFSKSADFIDKFIKELNLDKSSKILDVDTGFGAMAIFLALNGFTVITGQLEEDPHNHDDFRHDHHEQSNYGNFDFNWKKNDRALGVEDKIKFQFIDAENYPFPDESFDGIFMYNTLQYVGNKKLALHECIRLMEPEGLTAIIEWNEKAIEEDFKKYGYKIDFIDPRKYLKDDEIIIKLVKGDHLNIYILQKS